MTISVYFPKTDKKPKINLMCLSFVLNICFSFFLLSHYLVCNNNNLKKERLDNKKKWWLALPAISCWMKKELPSGKLRFSVEEVQTSKTLPKNIQTNTPKEIVSSVPTYRQLTHINLISYKHLSWISLRVL